MGTVYRARDMTIDQVVAIKFLVRPSHAVTPGLAHHAGQLSPNELKRFERERDMHEKLGGHGIPRLVAYDFLGGRPYLVTEFVDGKNLRDFLASHRPTLTAIVSIIVQLLRIMDRVHASRVIHRDIKPQNVILADNGEVYVVDFGIALPDDPSATRHTEGHTPGSLGYKAPEIILGERNPTGAADVYGVGCITFRLVTGDEVFNGASAHIIEQRHCTSPAPRLDALIRGLPAGLADLVERMLAKTPALRPTAQEAVDALTPLLPKLGDPAPDPALAPDPTLPFRTDPGATAPALRFPDDNARSRRPVVRRRGTGALGRPAFQALMDRTERELTEGGLGPEAERLNAMLPVVRRSWGAVDPDVVRARLLCADGLRHIGDWPGAGARYRTLVRDLDTTQAGTPEHARLLEALIGAAECLIPEEDSTDQAFPAWRTAVLELRNLLPHPPLGVVRRARESSEEFAEWGHREAVTALLDGLPPA
ncbi:serine/threonine-protein kinase [Streptomyces sp. UNOC14_S4]|uniref:serine/threonine-protein kinase n=1 Tax=Streptomyces sp. UNOC14_S4 TaxID=2872340 RepID=UPI001E52137E|nr:serine/threonine-protein kinase [Streptomyces sp. UNOC14_S4]MCC3766826.1 serine/threonine protein kinase [Streptomyces sp. UNOC14_S4]